MGFLEDLGAALDENAAFFGADTASGVGGDFFDFGFGGDVFFLDNETGQFVTLAEALATPGLSASEIQGLIDVARPSSTPSAEPGTSQAGDPFAANAPSGTAPNAQQTVSFVGDVVNFLKDNVTLKGVGTTLLAAAGVGGLISAIVGMTRNADGSGTITLPDNRTVTLSPEERQLLDIGVTQAKQQAGISNLTLPALASAAEAAAPDIMRLMSTGTKTAADQAVAQSGVTGAANTAAVGKAADIFGSDLTAARALQTGVQAPAIANLSQLVAGDQPTAAETLSGKVGTTVDERILDMIQNPEGTYQLARGQVAKGLKGDLPVNPMVARLLAEEEEKWKGRLQSELGPGYATSTPGERALLDFGQRKIETIANDNRTQTQLADAIARGEVANVSAFSPVSLGRLSFDEGARAQRFGRAQSAAGTVGSGTRSVADIFGIGQTGGPSSSGSVATLLGERPGSLALQNLSQLAGIGTAQAGQQLSVEQLNQLLALARNSSLVTGGGNLLGTATSPFFAALSRSLFT